MINVTVDDRIVVAKLVLGRQFSNKREMLLEMKRGLYEAIIASTAEELKRRYCGSGRVPLHSGFGKSRRLGVARIRASASGRARLASTRPANTRGISFGFSRHFLGAFIAFELIFELRFIKFSFTFLHSINTALGT